MTAAEYLTARGWIRLPPPPDEPEREWYDPQHYGAASEVTTDQPVSAMDIADALTIQRARDAAEERAAWVRFAAAASGMVGTNGDGVSDAFYSHAGAAKTADAMLAEYRARFAVEVEP